MEFAISEIEGIATMWNKLQKRNVLDHVQISSLKKKKIIAVYCTETHNCYDVCKGKKYNIAAGSSESNFLQLLYIFYFQHLHTCQVYGC